MNKKEKNQLALLKMDLCDIETRMSPKASNANNFGQRRNEKYQFGIRITFCMKRSMVMFNFENFRNIDPTMTSQCAQGPEIPPPPPKSSNINNL